jgi:hypothetical protein
MDIFPDILPGVSRAQLFHNAYMPPAPRVFMNTGKIVIPLCIVAVLIVLLSGCVSPSQAGDAAAASYKTYDNPEIGVRLEYPADWKYSVEHAPNVTSIQFTRKDGDLMAMLQTGDAAGTATPPRTLDQWRDDLLRDLPHASHRTEYQLVASNTTTFSGYPTHRIEYTALMNSGVRMRGEVNLMVIGTKGYMAILIGRDSPDSILAEGPQHFIRSITITP